MLAEMFRQLEKSSAPVHLVDQLKEYRDTAWKALNSYAHGGIHPISRTVTGYPPQFSVDVLRKPDVLVAIAAQLPAILSGSREHEPGASTAYRLPGLHSNRTHGLRIGALVF